MSRLFRSSHSPALLFLFLLLTPPSLDPRLHNPLLPRPIRPYDNRTSFPPRFIPQSLHVASSSSHAQRYA